MIEGNTLIHPTVANLQEGKSPYLFFVGGDHIHNELFSIGGYFSWPERDSWRAEWTISDQLVWRVDGNVRGSDGQEHQVLKVAETRQEVKHIIGPLYFATLWIRVTVGQPEDLNLSLDVTSNPPSNARLRSAVNLRISVYAEWSEWSECKPNLERRRTRTSTDGRTTDIAVENCNHITGLTQPNFCSQHGFAGPRVLLLGATGVGKSTLGNLLFGVNKGGCERRGRCIKCRKGMCRFGHCLEFDPADKKCVRCKPGRCMVKRGGCAEQECLERHNYQLGEAMPETEPLPFEPGGGIDSKTLVTKPIAHQFLGNGPCITLIDTPGNQSVAIKFSYHKHFYQGQRTQKEGTTSMPLKWQKCSKRNSSQAL